MSLEGDRERVEERFLQSDYKLGPLKYLPQEVFNGNRRRIQGARSPSVALIDLPSAAALRLPLLLATSLT